MKLDGEQLERFKKYVTSGRPVVAVRTASHAVQTWLEFDKEVLGGNYKSHHPVGPVTQISVKPAGASHPILSGVELTKVNDALYKNLGYAADIQVLLAGTIPGQPSEPIAWTRDYQGGRIFYTSLGAQDTFETPSFRRMLANALFWTAHREPQPVWLQPPHLPQPRPGPLRKARTTRSSSGSSDAVVAKRTLPNFSRTHPMSKSLIAATLTRADWRRLRRSWA
ncbi:MAG: ThuA domain-containing protein [Pirellulaceae bacterium]|nr:ThuA domain-containing protein [Pirellulaceae bacterium]